MTWINDLTRALGSEKKSWVSQIYNWKIPGVESKFYPGGKASLKQLYSPEGMEKGGQFIREAAWSRGSGFTKGLLNLDREKPFKALDTSGEGGGLINLEFPEIVIPEFPEIPDIVIPPFPKIPEIPDVSEQLDNFSTSLAMGLAAMGQGVGGGLGGIVPQMPSMQLMDEEGAPNILLIGGLAGVAYMVLKGRK